MGIRVWEGGILMLLLWARLTFAAEPTLCPTESLTDSIFGFPEWSCPIHEDSRSLGLIGVTEVPIYHIDIF